VIVNEYKGLSEQGQSAIEIMEDMGYEVDESTVNTRGTRMEMVTTQENFDQRKDLANRQASAADAPRLTGKGIITSAQKETTSVNDTTAMAYMGDVGDIVADDLVVG